MLVGGLQLLLTNSFKLNLSERKSFYLQLPPYKAHQSAAKDKVERKDVCWRAFHFGLCKFAYAVDVVSEDVGVDGGNRFQWHEY